jgi:hypothetical protein
MNKPAQYSIKIGERTIGVSVDEQPGKVLLRLTCDVPGPIPDSPALNSFLDETVAAFEGDRTRNIILIYNQLAIVNRWDEKGNLLVMTGRIRDAVLPGDEWKQGSDTE